ncbi:MAG: tetratricopeptide repeat protein [Neisseria sp.]|nr:tetratricopeptide repeat protein [Neisseria sp.]
MNNTALPVLVSMLMLGACAAIEPAAPPQAPAPEPEPAVTESTTAIPYPTLDAQSQIDTLGLQIARLEHQLESLQTRIQQLERQHAPSPARTAAPPRQIITGGSAPAYAPSAGVESGRYNQALQQYRSGNYTAAVGTLRGADGGGSGSESARKSMYLLLQSHQRLANCESVINIGNRYANRFRSSAEAPEALYSVAQCQHNMQQRDIARDTWRKLIQTYPDSPAAARAYRQLNAR